MAFKSDYGCLKCKSRRLMSLRFYAFKNTHVQCTRSIVQLSKVLRGERSWFGELQLPLERALSHSAIKVYASAVSACHEGFGEKWVSNILSWNISNKAPGGSVWRCASLQEQPLDHMKPLSTQPFRPDGPISLRMLSMKSAFLFAWYFFLFLCTWAESPSESPPQQWPHLDSDCLAQGEHKGLTDSSLKLKLDFIWGRVVVQ